jgi:hypothetical protein
LERDHGDGNVETEHGNDIEGTISWGWEHGDGSMGMGAWDESVGTTALRREHFSVILFSD